MDETAHADNETYSASTMVALIIRMAVHIHRSSLRCHSLAIKFPAAECTSGINQPSLFRLTKKKVQVTKLSNRQKKG